MFGVSATFRACRAGHGFFRAIERSAENRSRSGPGLHTPIHEGDVFTKYSDFASPNFVFSVILPENLWGFSDKVWENVVFRAKPSPAGEILRPNRFGVGAMTGRRQPPSTQNRVLWIPLAPIQDLSPPLDTPIARSAGRVSPHPPACTSDIPRRVRARKRGIHHASPRSRNRGRSAHGRSARRIGGN